MNSSISFVFFLFISLSYVVIALDFRDDPDWVCFCFFLLLLLLGFIITMLFFWFFRVHSRISFKESLLMNLKNLIDINTF